MEAGLCAKHLTAQRPVHPEMLPVYREKADPDRLWVCDALLDGTASGESALLAPQAVQ